MPCSQEVGEPAMLQFEPLDHRCRQHCRLTICIELVELTNSETAAATPLGGGAKSLRSLSSLETGSVWSFLVNQPSCIYTIASGVVFGSRSSQLWRWEGLFYHFSFTGLTQSCGHLDLLKIGDSSISLAAVGLHLSDFQNRVAGHTAVYIASIQGFFTINLSNPCSCLFPVSSWLAQNGGAIFSAVCGPK